MFGFKKIMWVSAFVLLAAVCLAQESQYEIEIDMPIRDNGAAGGKINYIDRDTGKAVKTIDLLANNPFSNLDLPELTMTMNDQNEVTSMYYDLAGRDVSSWLPDLTQYERYREDVEIRETLTHLLADEANAPSNASAYLKISSSVQGRFVVVLHSLSVRIDGVDYAYLNRVQVSDYEHNALLTFETDDHQITDVLLTANSDAFIYAYGGSDIKGQVCLSGYRVIDTDDGSELFVHSNMNGSGVSLTKRDNNLFMYHYQDITPQGVNQCYHIINMSSNEVRELCLSDDQYIRLYAKRADRFTFYRTRECISGDYEDIPFLDLDVMGRIK